MDIASTLINILVVVVMAFVYVCMTRGPYQELRAAILQFEAHMDAGFHALRADIASMGARFMRGR